MLAFNEVDYPFSHDLDGLLKLCEKHGIEVPHTLSGVGRLSVFAVRLHYDASPAAQLNREQGLKWTEAAVTWARATIDETDAEAHDQADPDPDQTQPSS